VLTLSPVALKAIVDAPDTFLDPGWETGYHKLLAVMGEHHQRGPRVSRSFLTMGKNDRLGSSTAST